MLYLPSAQPWPTRGVGRSALILVTSLPYRLKSSRRRDTSSRLTSTQTLQHHTPSPASTALMIRWSWPDSRLSMTLMLLARRQCQPKPLCLSQSPHPLRRTPWISSPSRCIQPAENQSLHQLSSNCIVMGRRQGSVVMMFLWRRTHQHAKQPRTSPRHFLKSPSPLYP